MAGRQALPGTQAKKGERWAEEARKQEQRQGMSCTVNLFVQLHQRVGSFVATSKIQNQLEELPINYSKRHFLCGLGLSSIQKGVQH